MIERYTDHAANERTFLAWVRTSLALIALGCVLLKFEWLLRLGGGAVATGAPDGRAASMLGLLCEALAVLILVGSYRRYRQLRCAIAAPQCLPLSRGRLEAGLMLGMVVLALGLVWMLDGHG